MANGPIIPLRYNDVMRILPIGDTSSAVSNNLYGINHQLIETGVPKNKDRYGLTLFTRPQLNLSTNNIKNMRKLYSLLTGEPNSIQRYVRCMLDPRLNYGLYDEGPITSPLVDPLQAFIPVLSNNLVSISGWPGIASPTYTSKEGLYREQYSQVDGIVDNYSVYTIDGNYRNTIGDPIMWLIHVWSIYQSAVFEGMMYPYIDNIVYKRMDYNTRIYRLVLSEDKQVVTKIAASGASFPINDPTGEMFDYNTDKDYNSQTDNITVRWQCMGAQYLDDILIYEFNKVVQAFNPKMRDDARDISMIKIPMDWLPLFNNRGYARINQDTYHLEWWIDKQDFKRTKTTLSESAKKLGDNRG